MPVHAGEAGEIVKELNGARSQRCEGRTGTRSEATKCYKYCAFSARRFAPRANPRSPKSAGLVRRLRWNLLRPRGEDGHGGVRDEARDLRRGRLLRQVSRA